MVIKARLQGNSIVATFPKALNIKVGTLFEATKTSEGVLFKYVEDDFFNFEMDILKSIIKDGFKDEDIITEFKKRKSAFPEKIDKCINELRTEALSNTIVDRDSF